MKIYFSQFFEFLFNNLLSYFYPIILRTWYNTSYRYWYCITCDAPAFKWKILRRQRRKLFISIMISCITLTVYNKSSYYRFWYQNFCNLLVLCNSYIFLWIIIYKNTNFKIISPVYLSYFVNFTCCFEQHVQKCFSCCI